MVLHPTIFSIFPIIPEIINYNLRIADDIQTLHTCTNLYYISFFPSTKSVWNSLPEDTKQSPSISSFKFRHNRDLNKPPKYYNTVTRIGQLLHTRIRLECSSLNAHLYRKNIVPEPTCQCGGFKSSYHFFFVCPIFLDAGSKCLLTSKLNQCNDQRSFVRHGKQNKPRKRVTIYAGTRIHSGIRKVRSKLVKHDETLSTMFNAQHRKIVVVPFPLSSTFFLLFLFICHALMLILLSVH